jgi:uncharacterized protein
MSSDPARDDASGGQQVEFASGRASDPSAAQAWVGYAEIGGEAAFVRLDGRVAAPSAVRMDLPGRGIFGLRVTWEAAPSGVRGRVVIGGVAARLTGAVRQGEFAGQIVAGSTEGGFALQPAATWDLPRYRELCASYRAGHGRRLSVHLQADDWAGPPMLLYAEDDRLVRLHPAAGGRLISEAAEAFTLTSEGGGIESVHRLGHDPGPAEAVTRDTRWTEEDVATSGPDGVLAGTLMTPPGAGPHPAIVMVHGAAGGLRDVYRVFGEHFVQAGVAALVFDKRGHGGSAGNPEPTFDDKSRDAEAWVDFLQARPGIRRDRVGVWGFSNGSWVAPLLAARRPDVAFLAVIGAAGTTAVETEIHRRVFDVREQGISETRAGQVAELWRLVYHLLLTRQPGPGHAARFDQLSAGVRDSGELASLSLQPYAIQEPFLGPVPPYRTYQDVIDDLPRHPATDDIWSCDPVDSYRNIRVPVLFLVGDNDSNLPGPHGAQRVARTLHRAGNHRATVLVFPSTGHLMNLVEPGTDTGMTSEEAGYLFHHFRFAGGFRDIVRAWAAARLPVRA